MLATPEANQIERERILWIDDDPATLARGQMVLETLGHEVTIATSGRTALELLAAGTFRLVILDYDMPELNGEAVAREIKQQWPDLPILMITGGDVPMSANPRVDDFLLKGQPIPVLLEAISRQLRNVP